MRAKGLALSHEEGGDESRRLSRGEFLALGTAGVSALLVGGYAATAVGQSTRDGVMISYRGRRISVSTAGRTPEVSIDGQRLVVVDSGGAFRAAGYVFEPQQTASDLAKRLIDYRIDAGR